MGSRGVKLEQVGSIKSKWQCNRLSEVVTLYEAGFGWIRLDEVRRGRKRLANFGCGCMRLDEIE